MSDVSRSLQSRVSIIQSVVLTAGVFKSKNKNSSILIQNDRFLDDVQKSPLRKWPRLGVCIYYLLQCIISGLLFFGRRFGLIQLIALVGGGWTFSSRHVTMISLEKMKSSITREAHSVGLELGVSSYEVELHINNRWQVRNMWQWSACT